MNFDMLIMAPHGCFTDKSFKSLKFFQKKLLTNGFDSAILYATNLILRFFEMLNNVFSVAYFYFYFIK